MLTFRHSPFSRARLATIFVGAALLALGYALTAPGFVLGHTQPYLTLSSPVSLTAGTTSGTVTVTRLDAGGVAETSGDLVVSLSTNSPGPSHFVNASDATVATVTIPDGFPSVTFTYYDESTSGSQLTAAATGHDAGTAALTVDPAVIDHFSWTTQPDGTQTAGAEFTATVKAYDQYGNLKTNYNPAAGHGVVSSSVGNSPNGDPAVASVTWTSGIGDVSSTAYLATTSSQHLTVTDSDAPGSPLDSGNFTVDPNVAASTVFRDPNFGSSPGFNGQPLDTKIGTVIYSVCAPTSGAPCATSPTSTGVKVLVRDAYGNLVKPTTITLNIEGDTAVLATATTSSGIANFANSPIAPTTPSTSGIKLVADAPTGTDGLSDKFQVATDLKACNTNPCTNSGALSFQKVFNQIVATTTGGFFGGGRNVLLRTQFYDASTFGADASACGPSTLVGQGQEALPEGTGVTDSKPTTKMLIVISSAYLKSHGISARSASSFNACVGARWIGSTDAPANGWTAKPLKGGGTVATHADANGVYWGLARPCGSLPKGSTDPCIDLATKNAADVKKYFGFTASETAALVANGDIAIVIRKLSPWDGKGSVYS